MIFSTHFNRRHSNCSCRDKNTGLKSGARQSFYKMDRLSKVWYICFRVLFFFFQCILSLWMCFIFLQEDFEGKKKLLRYSKIYIQSAKLINHSARTNWEIQNLACNSRHLFVWRLHKFAQAFVELIWFQFYNLFFCHFFCLRNSPRTKRTLMLVSCQSCVTWLYVYFAWLYFGKRKWKFEFEKDRYVCWWPTIQNNRNGSYHHSKVTCL